MTNAGKQTPNANRQTSGKHKARGMHAAFCIAAGMVCLSVIAAAQQPGPKSKPVTPARKALLQPDSLPISPTIPGANRYQRDKVFLERANEMRAEQGKDYQIVVGDVEFRKGDMIM